MIFSSLGWTEILIILGVGVVLFGKRLPDIGRTVGRSLMQFRKGMSEMKDELVKGIDEPLDPNKTAAPTVAAPTAAPLTPQAIPVGECKAYDEANAIHAAAVATAEVKQIPAPVNAAAAPIACDTCAAKPSN
jgi:sec-independent protein translocase protein TatA